MEYKRIHKYVLYKHSIFLACTKKLIFIPDIKFYNAKLKSTEHF